MENLDFLLKMLDTVSVSGHEAALQQKCVDFYRNFVDRVSGDATGNVYYEINPEADFTILMSGHIDEIGCIITYIQSNGCVRVARCGGIRPSGYVGHRVQCVNKHGTFYGCVAASSSLMKKADVSDSDLVIDFGFSNKEEAEKYLHVGDCITFDVSPRLIGNQMLSGRALDDRLGAFIVLEAIKKAKERNCCLHVVTSLSVGEETTMRGAHWAASKFRPSVAIAVDVTYANDAPMSDPAETGDIALGKGPAICLSSIVNKKLNERLRNAAEKCGLNVQEEVAAGRTGTDADKMHFVDAPVAVCLVSIPLRYMHTPAELCHLKDVEDCIALLSEFICQCSSSMDLCEVKF